MKKITLKLTAVAALALAFNAFAGEVTVVNVKLVSVSVIGATPTGAHTPGNAEIRVPPGTIPNAGLSCAGNGGAEYITWKVSNDPDRAMLRIAQDAVVSGKTVNLRITDAAALTAWGQRCSLVAIGVNHM